MSKLLTEQKVLKKLNIKNFKHLKKEQVFTMASMLDKMDPEVAKKVIEQFPEFASTMKEILCEYKESLDKALESNDKSVHSYYNSADAIITSLQEELKKEELAFDDRKYIIDKMLEVQKMKGEKDSENKWFIITIAGMGFAALAGVFAVGLQGLIGSDTEAD